MNKDTQRAVTAAILAHIEQLRPGSPGEIRGICVCGQIG
jgi:hypothetical protein